MNQLQLLSPGWAARATGQTATRENKLLPMIGVKRTFDELGNEHLEHLGIAHTLACGTDNNGDVLVEPRSGGDAGIKSTVKPHMPAHIPTNQCPEEHDA